MDAAARAGIARTTVRVAPIWGWAWLAVHAQAQVPAPSQDQLLLGLAPPSRLEWRWGETPRQDSVFAAASERTRLVATVRPIDLGLNWRYALNPQHTIDIAAWRRIDTPGGVASLVRLREPTYGARVEVQWTPARSGLVADYRFLGVQLQDGARIGVRSKGGRPLLYYRAQF